MSRRKPSTPGIEVCEITGAAADAVIEAANSNVVPLEPRRKVVSMEEQYRMAHPEARLSPETQRALARQNNEVKTDNLGFWG